jgi:hypothetical protein
MTNLTVAPNPSIEITLPGDRIIDPAGAIHAWHPSPDLTSHTACGVRWFDREDERDDEFMLDITRPELTCGDCTAVLNGVIDALEKRLPLDPEELRLQAAGLLALAWYLDPNEEPDEEP